MKLKIISDGTRAGTKVVNEAGDSVEGVTDIEWRYSQEDGQVWAVVTIGDAGLDAPACNDAPAAEALAKEVL